jgi:uncharacterized lipoprotein YmbA
MRIATLLIALMLAACSGQPVQTQYYLLRTDAAQSSRDLKPSQDFAMGEVIIAAYIDQPGLVLETRRGEIRPAVYHQWAEPMYQGVRNLLIIEISQALGEDVLPARARTGETIVDIRVDQLHGTEDGDALLVAYWWLRRDGKVMDSFQFAERQSLSRDGYGALADAQQSLMVRLSRRIAETMDEARSSGS